VELRKALRDDSLYGPLSGSNGGAIVAHEADSGSAPARQITLPYALDIRGVSHAYGERPALDNVSISVASGEFCALLGLNGAGKSTLFGLITRLFVTRGGSIRILGFDIGREPSQALRRMGVVFQNRTLDPELSVLQNLAYHAALHGFSSSDGRRLALEALDRVLLADRARDKVKQLSGGQMRRVEIARALIHRPRLLLLDEPTVGLDIASRLDIRQQVRRLVAEDGLGVLWATHILEEVNPGDHVVILHRGRVLADGTGASIVHQARADSLAQAFSGMTGMTNGAEGHP
jgi:ABC-2 type transport system ATP-binding protein